MTTDAKENLTLRKARKLIRSQQYSDAITLLTNALEETPGDRLFLELLGMAHFRAGSHEEAKAAFEKLTRADPMFPGGWVNLGAVCNVLGDYRRATDVLRKAIQRDRRCASAYYNLGIAQKGQHQSAMAISAYKEALKLDPGLTEASLNLGNLYMDAKNYKQAARAFQQGVDSAPESVKLKKLLARATQAVEGNRRVESPFGRLVDEKELALRQSKNARRVLDSASRNQEREGIRTIVRELRHSARPLVPLLDESLHRELHLLHLAVVEKDTRGQSPAAFEDLVQTMKDLEGHRETMQQASSEIRTQIKRTDPGLLAE